jgi:hypothetical protein
MNKARPNNPKRSEFMMRVEPTVAHHKKKYGLTAVASKPPIKAPEDVSAWLKFSLTPLIAEKPV